MGIPGPGFVVSAAPGFLNQDPKSPPNGSALKTHRAKNKEREKGRSHWWNISLWLHLMSLVIYRCRGFLRASKSHGRTQDTNQDKQSGSDAAQ